MIAAITATRTFVAQLHALLHKSNVQQSVVASIPSVVAVLGVQEPLVSYERNAILLLEVNVVFYKRVTFV